MKSKFKLSTMTVLGLGLVIYLTGLCLLFISSLNHNIKLFLMSNTTSFTLKIVGFCLFVLGFVIFMIAVTKIYKNNKVKESKKDLIVEGKADVITIIISTYVMIIMIVLCLFFDQILGALFFGITILIQSVVNSLLIKYYSKRL